MPAGQFHPMEVGGRRGAVVEPSTVCFQWVMNHANFDGCCLENLGLRPRSTRLQRKAGRCSAGKAVCDPDKAATTFSRDEPGPGADAPNLLVTNAVQVEAGRLSSRRWKTCSPTPTFDRWRLAKQRFDL
jgi:hypothetical protein